MLRFDYNILCDEIKKIKEKYPFIQVSSEGKSLKGRSLFLLSFGKGEREIFINGAHHGMEWITSPVIMKFLTDCCESYISGKRLRGTDIRDIYEKLTIYAMPMVNPDGVDIAVNRNLRWQANGAGVDLNHNYNAMWEKARELEEKAGITGPCESRYGGPAPESEPETRAVTDFVRRNNIQMLIALHTQGEEIYYSFAGLEPKESISIAMQMSRVSGYKLAHPEEIASYGGCKDWFISEYRRPGFTIEAGHGKNPLPPEQFDELYEKVANILTTVLLP